MDGKKLSSILLSLFIVVIFSTSVAAEIHPGKQKAEDERCAECHGVDGNLHAPNESAKIPKLAGQNTQYLLKQFQDFRSGERHNDFMALMARNLEDEEVVDILAWYGSQAIMAPSEGAVTVGNSLGEKLYRAGDLSRGIVACAACHGIAGRGVVQSPSSHPTLLPELIPVIGGQDWYYLDQQLRDWRSGERSNSAGAIMNTVTEKLTDAEITALSDYISTLK